MTWQRPRQIGALSMTVLLVILVGYPLPRGSGLIPPPSTGSRADWWLFWLIVGAGHWICFGLVALVLRHTGEPWSSLGVDWNRLKRRWPWLVAALAVLIVASFTAPRFHYGSDIPVRDALFPLLPTTTAERLFWILGGGVTAGVVEEIIFRGFALTRLGRLLGSPWLALPFSSVAFIFLHGMPPSLAVAANFAAVGLVFGSAFIIMKCRRLEILIILHAAVNCVYIFLG